MAAEASPEGGLRERKKAKTRKAIYEAALELFAEKGYRDTRVADIAAAADVSDATFFRYFASKEEVALVDLMASIDVALEALQARPAEEAPLTACRAVANSADALTLVPGDRAVFLVMLMAENRSLAGHFFGEMVRVNERLATEFGRRLGAAATDLEPQLLAASVIGALQSVLVHWLANPTDTDTRALAEKAFTMLADGLG